MGDNRTARTRTSPQRVIAASTRIARASPSATTPSSSGRSTTSSVTLIATRCCAPRHRRTPVLGHCWSGAHVLAARVPSDAGHVSRSAAARASRHHCSRRGARVVFVDRDPTRSLSSAQASKPTTAPPRLVVATFATPSSAVPSTSSRAEVLYDRIAFATIATTFARLIAPGGRVLLTDATASIRKVSTNQPPPPASTSRESRCA